MSSCLYCGNKCGWFSTTHDECFQRAEQGKKLLDSAIYAALVSGKRYEDVGASLSKISAEHLIPHDEVITVMKEAWSRAAVERAMKEPLNEAEFNLTWRIPEGYGLTKQDLVSLAGFRNSCFSYILFTVLHDAIDPYQGPIRFNMSADEVPIFGFANVLLSEDRVSRSYAGGYSGASVRIGNGLYYHFGGMKGQPIESHAVQEVDYGGFLITTEGVYFGGDRTNFKLPYRRIIRTEPYANGIAIAKDGGKPQIFQTTQQPDSGWFLFNVIEALSKRTMQAGA
jgi:hypothetical protein